MHNTIKARRTALRLTQQQLATAIADTLRHLGQEPPALDKQRISNYERTGPGTREPETAMAAIIEMTFRRLESESAQ